MKVKEFIEQLLQNSSSPLKQVYLVGSALSFEESRTDESGDEYFVTVSRALGAFPDGRLCLALMVTECRDLETLILKNQALFRDTLVGREKSEDLDAIAFIVRNNLKLKVLNLEGSWFTWNDHGLNFLRCFETTSCLEELNLKKCRLDDQALDCLGEVLKSNKSLRKLHIGNPHIGKVYYVGKQHSFSLDAFDRFVTALNENTSLVECDIGVSITSRVWHFSRFNAIKKRLDTILARNKQRQYNNVSSSHAVSSTSSSSLTSSTAIRPQISSVQENKSSYSQALDYLKKNYMDHGRQDRRTLIWAHAIIGTELSKDNDLLKPYKALLVSRMSSGTEKIALATLSQSSVISNANNSVSTTTLMSNDLVRQLLINTATLWVDLLVKRGHQKGAVTLVVTATLRALCNNKWAKILEGHASGEIPEAIVPLLDKFIQKNPILYRASEHPRTIERICENLLESLSDSTESTADESSSLSNQNK